jgi:signal transduction histidine kinase
MASLVSSTPAQAATAGRHAWIVPSLLAPAARAARKASAGEGAKRGSGLERAAVLARTDARRCSLLAWVKDRRNRLAGRKRPRQPATAGGAPPPRPGNRRFRLIAWFLALSLLSVTAVSTASAYLLARFMTERLLALDVKLTTETVNHLFAADSADGQLATPGTGGPAPELARFFAQVGGMPDVLRANIYRLDGTVVWSTDPRLVGQRFADNKELAAAAGGQPTAAMAVAGSEGDKTEHVGLAAPGQPFVENYLPMFRGGRAGAEVVGLLEVYRTPQAVLDTIRSGQRLIFASAGLGALLILGSLCGLVHRADRVIRRQERALAEGQRLATASEMAAAVAHSLRNPLASIRSSAELAMRLRSPERVQALLDDIVRQSDRLAHWVRQYLSAVEPEGGSSGAELPSVLARVRATCASELERYRIAWREAASPGLPAARIEPGLLEQILNGIVSNAIQAMPDGGTIAVTAQVTENGLLELRVADSGCGMTPEELAQAFVPFATTKPTGLGLGLALARRILERHGARLTLKSELGRGTVASLHLPIAR